MALLHVRMLLMLDDDATRVACTDYFVTHGCEVDDPSDVIEAEGLLRFRDYDVVVADFPREEHDTTLRVLDLAHRRKGAMLRVLLTTDGTAVADEDVVVLTKPQPLDAILARM